MTSETPARPKRVVVVDAENPLVEIHGEFFWREDHDAIVDAVRAEAYRDGYQAGQRDVRTPVAPTQQIVVRYKQPLGRRLLQFGMGALLLVIAATTAIAVLRGS